MTVMGRFWLREELHRERREPTENIGDVLTVSPLLLEKYLQAAEKIVREAVPTVARVVNEKKPSAASISAATTATAKHQLL